MIRVAPLALVASLFATPVLAAPEAYVLDPSHSQILFSYNHLGFSTSYGLFSGFDGKISYDAAAPADSSVEVAFPVKSMLTGWQARFDHFMSPDFFDAADDEMVSFKSTAIEVTGEKTAKITGELTLNGVTKPVTIQAELSGNGTNGMSRKETVGFHGTTTIKRSDWGMGWGIPFGIGDEIDLNITVAFEKQ